MGHPGLYSLLEAAEFLGVSEMVVKDFTPQIFPEHGSNYYATFFKDLDGIKYEIVYNQPI